MIVMTIAAIVIIIIILSYLSCDGFTTIILYLPQGSVTVLCYSLLSITRNEGEREHFVYVQLLTEQIQLLCQDDDGERLSIRPTGICEAITG